MSTPGTSQLQARWNWIESHRGEIANALQQLSKEMPRQDRILLTRLAGWFAGKAGFEAAIKRPDVLAICLPLIQGNFGDESSQADIERAVRIGFCSIGQTLSTRGRLWSLFLLPALVVAAMAVLAVFFSVAIIPQFQAVLEDFGIELPKLTNLLFKLAWVVRSSWAFLFGCLVAFAGLAMFMNALTSGRRIAGESWLEQRFKTTRNAVAGWAWHLALLLDAGITTDDAIEIAGDSQSKSWLKRACQNWIRQHSHTTSDENSISPSFGRRYRLIQTTLGIDNQAAQVDLLKEVATYYWARNRTIGDWWIEWLIAILFWIFVGVIVLAVFALYSPMLSVISGLTGITSGLAGVIL